MLTHKLNIVDMITNQINRNSTNEVKLHQLAGNMTVFLDAK